ncbi:MAG TPA: hypothetical protein VD861_16850 [Pyrinomonadaceae bacterium]|nr:hypothetical protein [Pyrinomonadaceae bacterium]
MRRKNPEFSRARRGLLLAACAVTLLACVSQAALAQSGRRQNKPLSPPTPVATKDEGEAKPEAKPRDTRPAALATIIVGGDKFGNSSSIIPGYVTEAVEGCILELNKSRSLDARGGGYMTRKEAIDRAKKETEAHVLWLDVRIHGNRQDDIAVSYTIFTPQTAKVLTFGNVYLATRRAGRGPVGVGLPPVGGRNMPLQYLMREAGRDVAERVMDKLQTATRD